MREAAVASVGSTTESRATLLAGSLAGRVQQRHNRLMPVSRRSTNALGNSSPNCALFFASLFLILCGCAPSHSAATVPDRSLPATTRAIPPRPPEIRYGTHLKPESLSPEQVAELTAIVRGKQPAGRDIWFILVHSNYLNEGRLRYRATVYFTPDETS